MQFVLGGGVDYTSGPYTATFIARTTNTSFNVTISNDSIYGEDVYFNLTINQLSTPYNVTVGDIGQARVIIVDDDCK